MPSVYFRMYNYNLGIFVPMKDHYISHIWPWHHYFNWFPPFLLYSERDNIICTPNETRASHNSGVHVLLVSLFGIPIVRSISQFFGRPNFFLVYQQFFWSTKFFFWLTKRIRNWPDNWFTKETDQKYMDTALKWCLIFLLATYRCYVCWPWYVDQISFSEHPVI